MRGPIKVALPIEGGKMELEIRAHKEIARRTELLINKWVDYWNMTVEIFPPGVLDIKVQKTVYDQIRNMRRKQIKEYLEEIDKLNVLEKSNRCLKKPKQR